MTLARWAPLLLLALVAAGCQRAPAPDTAPPALDEPPPASVDEVLAQLLEQHWQQELLDDPVMATFLGDHRYGERWPDLRESAIERRHAEDQITLEKLGVIDRTQLQPSRRLDYDLLRRELEDRIEGHAFREFLVPVTPQDGVQLISQLADFAPFNTLQDYEHWLTRLQNLGTLVDQTILLMQRGMAEGRLPTRIVMQRVPAQLAAQQPADPTQSPFYAPFLKLPPGIPADVGAQLALAGQAVVAESVIPAFARLQAFIERDYLPACPAAPGLSARPEGARHYAWRVRHHTGTRLTPEAIHELGLREVARIQGEMDRVIRSTGHKGSLASFFQRLRTDARFRYTDSAALLDAYRAIAKRIDPELPRLFSQLPRLPYGVKAIPDVAAPAAPTGYYYPGAADGSRAGNFYANVYQPQTRNTWEMEALTLHEAVPGHHLQIALAQELPDLPAFRRNGLRFTAYTEGWGLYAESLGGELGLYQDPYSHFGQLVYEMWRAVRLVVDTGLHAKGWTRQQALDYFLARTPKSALDAASEIDRYIADPGQALAYKIGELKIRELRRRSELALGERFDIRAFHQVILGQGPLPLDLLEREVDGWIEQRKSAPPRTPAAAAG